MADQRDGGIAWTQETWNPVRGCSRVSAGCTHCYAERMAARFSGPGGAFEGLVKVTTAGPRWTGKLRLVEEHLDDPLRWRRPRRVFVGSMTDLFHDAVSDADLLRVFDVMRDAHHRGHTFQLLTKRAARMRQFCSQLDFDAGSIGTEGAGMRLADRGINRQGMPISFMSVLEDIWLGVSVEDQAAADSRIPELIATPAAVRWLSIEPQLGPVKLSPEWLARLHWVVIGGESGPGARSFHLDWARSLVAHCKAAGVRAFVKQVGARPEVDYYDAGARAVYEAAGAEWPDPIGWVEGDGQPRPGSSPVRFETRAKAGGDPAEWPEDLRVREFPEACQ